MSSCTAVSGPKKCQFSNGKTNTFENHLQKCAPRSRDTCRAESGTFVVVAFPQEKLHFLHIIQRHQRIKLLKALMKGYVGGGCATGRTAASCAPCARL